MSFRGCDDLLEALLGIVHGWRAKELAPGRGPQAPLRISRSRHGYRRVSPRFDTPSSARSKERRTLVEALCGLHSELLDWYVEAHPDQLFLHGAAVRFGRTLALFPALAKAGKSTLTVQLAAAGHTVFTDDVLPVEATTGEGLALGIVPRLRPPLPRSLGPRFHRFVAARAGLARKNRLYVRLRKGELAPFGARSRIGAVVLLERVPGVRAALTPVDPGDALERVILQNFARDRPSPVILETLASVVESAACYRLRYARGEPAVRVLERALLPARRPVRTRAGS